jgi:hypothetical protein
MGTLVDLSMNPNCELSGAWLRADPGTKPSRTAGTAASRELARALALLKFTENMKKTKI